MYQANGLIGVGTTAPLISVDARTGTFPQMGMAGTTDYLTFFASDVFGPAIYWDPGKDMRFGKGGAGLYNPYGFVEQMRIQSSTGNVGIGTTAPVSKLDVNGNINFSGSVLYQGSPVLQVFGGFSSANTALGLGALANNPTGTSNTATGYGALLSNTTGSGNTASGFAALGNYSAPGGNTAVGYQALLGGATVSNNTGSNNTAAGYQALYSNTTGTWNTASGYSALHSNTTGNENNASGNYALSNNTTGSQNDASGYSALHSNTNGSQNTASGAYALYSNTAGTWNDASGYSALYSNTTGTFNMASGNNALLNNTTGNYNTAVGYAAGGQLTTGSNNIMIGNEGTSSDDHIIRIGDVQTKTFIAGIQGITTGASNPVAVMIDINGQLGTVNSSRRFKEDIQDMGDASNSLMRLRPVTYRYKQPYADGSKPLDYGLIAEEVAEVYPDLVVTNKDGQVETVQYQKLTPMLLNELQKQNQHEQQQDDTIKQQNEQIRKLEARLAAVEALLSGKAPTTATGGQ